MKQVEMRQRLLKAIAQTVAPIRADWIDGEHACEGAEQKATPFTTVDGYAYRWGWYPSTGLLHFAGLNPGWYEPPRDDLLPLTEPMPLVRAAAPLLHNAIDPYVAEKPDGCVWHAVADLNPDFPRRHEEYGVPSYTFQEARDRAVAVTVEMLVQRASGS